MFRIALILTMFAASLPAVAQAQTPDVPVVLPDAASSDDIIVRALRIPREKLPTGIYWDYQTVLQSRIVRENAEMFMRCALKIGNADLMRTVVDGEPNSATSRYAQGLITVAHRGCYPPNRYVGLMFTNAPNDIASRGVSWIDRGVIVETALRSYAPDAALTPAMMADPAVQSRFAAREGVRNRLRFPQDRDALIYAACLVKAQPVLATRLFRSDPGSALERGLTQTIVLEGRSCSRGIDRVTIDPSLMRVYVIDAFYRWVVAARGVDSLIPAGA